MANPKASKKSAPRAKRAGAEKGSAAPVAAYEPSKDRRALRELMARHGPVDDDHREAFDELIDAEGRAKLGGQTRAPGVLRDGVGWAVQIDQALTKYPAQVRTYYSVARFTYFLDRLAALDGAIEEQKTRRGAQGTHRSTTADREAAARTARQDLISKLRGFAGRRAAERNALEAAIGRIDDVTTLGESMAALDKLARSWIAREGRSAEIQRRHAGLGMAVVDAARSAAEALTGAATTATLGGKRSAIDAPEVNLVEGTVLYEMEEALRCFDEAHAKLFVVARLVPGRATRHVLGPKKPSKKAAPAPAVAPVAPAPG